MTRFIQLTPIGGEDAGSFHINGDAIVSVNRIESLVKGKVRTVVTTTSGQTYAVTELPDDIFAAIDLLDEPADDKAPSKRRGRA